MIKEGFTLEDLAYTASWVIKRYPDTGSFERISHFIDQALKEKVMEEKTQEVEHRLRVETEQRQAEEQRIGQEQEKIKRIRATLPSKELEQITQEALKILQEENSNITFGREILLRLKVDELLMARYFSQI